MSRKFPTTLAQYALCREHFSSVTTPKQQCPNDSGGGVGISGGERKQTPTRIVAIRCQPIPNFSVRPRTDKEQDCEVLETEGKPLCFDFIFEALFGRIGVGTDKFRNIYKDHHFLKNIYGRQIVELREL